MQPHGTRTRYTHHGCRCDACREANAAYKRELKGAPKRGSYTAEWSWERIFEVIGYEALTTPAERAANPDGAW